MKTIGLIAGIIFFALLFRTSESPSTPSYLGVEDYSFEDYDEVLTSDNWDCTSDCSGHEAGYEWAEENGIIDPDECDGNSVSFIEGCQAWANEQMIEESYYEDEYEQAWWEDAAY